VLGGSTMFGHGATSDQTTIPGYMQKFLQNQGDKFKIEIINGGIQGADSFAELNLTETKLLSYSPDMVIVYDGWNDLREENTAETIHENWNLICEIGQQNNFDVIIALQPIAGFGNKILTEQEAKYAKSGTKYNGAPLINSLSEYEKYTSNLNDLENCTSSINLRTVFDNESSPIYWDQGHVSDNGNNIVAKALFDEILEFIPRDTLSTIPTTYDAGEINENKFEDQIRYLLSNYKTTLMIGSIFSFELHLPPVSDIQETEEILPNIEIKERIFETQSQIFDDDKIHIEIEIFDNQDYQKQLRIKTINETDNSFIPNVTYFLKIVKDDEIILSDFFYVEDKIFILDVIPNNSKSIIVSGERQYDHNAFIASVNPPLKISGSILETDVDYDFIIELRTIYEKSNWIFSLDGFHAQIVK